MFNNYCLWEYIENYNIVEHIFMKFARSHSLNGFHKLFAMTLRRRFEFPRPIEMAPVGSKSATNNCKFSTNWNLLLLNGIRNPLRCLFTQIVLPPWAWKVPPPMRREGQRRCIIGEVDSASLPRSSFFIAGVYLQLNTDKKAHEKRRNSIGFHC